MRVWGFEDPRRWGPRIVNHALIRGHDARTFTVGAEIEGDHAFYRLDQRFPAVETHRAHALRIAETITLVPDARMIRHYEDKWLQTEASGVGCPILI